MSVDRLSIVGMTEAIRERFPAVDTHVHVGELTVQVTRASLLDVLRFCRDEPALSCELLSDLSAVHWPAGEHVIERQPSTTGWPVYRTSREQGMIEVLYILRSITHGHWLRVAVATDDSAPTLPSVVPIYPTANFHEREVFDMFGVEFDGHPDLTRILMPDDWLGHPHRKDYPLGGVDVPYKNDRFIPPPDERDLREVIS